MDEKKKNVPLIIALSIPVLMIVFVAVSIYLPSLFVKPTTDFIFSMGGDYYSQKKYSVNNGKIVEHEIKYPPENTYATRFEDPKIFYYDVKKDTAREIILEDAQRFILDSNYKSADGFEVAAGNSGGDFFFGYSGSYYKKYIKKGAFSKELNIGPNYMTNYYSFTFLGWVKE